MSSRRTMILIAALVVGALATFALVNYVGGIEDRANRNARRVDVIRIAQDIVRGTDGDTARRENFFDEGAEIPQEFLPGTAITDIETILGKVAITNLAAGQVLVEGMFVDPVNSQVTAARRITTGNVAVTISVDEVRGVAGLIVPGDFVNILVRPTDSVCGVADPEAAAAEASAAIAEGLQPALLCNPARYLYQQVQVLFVDRSPIPLPGEQGAPAPGTGEEANRGLITFSVPPAAAQLIASIGSGENVYLTLLPPDYTPAPLPPIDPLLPVLPGEDAAQLTPCGPEGCEPEDNP